MQYATEQAKPSGFHLYRSYGDHRGDSGDCVIRSDVVTETVTAGYAARPRALSFRTRQIINATPTMANAEIIKAIKPSMSHLPSRLAPPSDLSFAA